MTDQLAAPQLPPAESLVERLMAVVRPEFRADVLVVAVDDPILGGGGACRVPECRRGRVHRDLCNAHYIRWRHSGCPDLEGFLATTTPATKGHHRPRQCSVAGCGRGCARNSLCNRHAKAWNRAGRPVLRDWLPTVPPDPGEGEPCAVPGCDVTAEPRRPGAPRPLLCLRHRNRWYGQGRPPLSELVQRCATYGEPTVDFSRLPRQLRLEIQYGVQCRVDEHTTRLPARHLSAVVGFLAECDLPSLLADRQRVCGLVGDRFRAQSTERAFVRYTIERLDDLVAGIGWEREYPRDCWRLARVGIDKAPGGQATLRFGDIAPDWLRELAKRHARLRLTTGVGPGQVGMDVLALTRLSRVLVDAAGQAPAITRLDRELIERYLAWLRSQGRSDSFQRGHTAALSTFLDAVRRHDWAPGLPSDAIVYPDDYPRPRALASRNLSEHVMRQVEDPANLERFDDPAVRLMTELLVRTGLRSGDARNLPVDCLIRDDDAAAYLRYTNHKLAREAFVPVDEELEARIGEQQRRVRQRWPEGRVRLFPASRNNPDGHTPIGRTHYMSKLMKWIEACDIRDETGAPVHLTPHQFRHTYGTRLINSGVPEEVVRKLLDHDSPDMTAHYARLQLKTVRREWEKARKVDIAGEPVSVDPDGPLADAAWMKENLGRAKQALPNGYCGLPLQRTCPHANACLTCPVFVTTAEFLPQHREQREHTLKLIAVAEADGHARMVEMNQQVLDNLDNIITALEAPEELASGEVADAG